MKTNYKMSNKKLKAILVELEDPNQSNLWGPEIVNIQNLDQEDYEDFLDYMEKLKTVYLEAKQQ